MHQGITYQGQEYLREGEREEGSGKQQEKRSMHVCAHVDVWQADGDVKRDNNKRANHTAKGLPHTHTHIHEALTLGTVKERKGYCA